jgi:hypothetical protein
MITTVKAIGPDSRVNADRTCKVLTDEGRGNSFRFTLAKFN